MRGELFDAGTKLLKGVYGGGSQLDVLARPGMDFGSYRELDMEYDFRDDDVRIPQINKAIIETPITAELLPWPLPWPGRMWIDWTRRYYAEDGGFVLEAFNQDSLDPHVYDPAPAGEMRIMADPEPEVDRDESRGQRNLDMEEVQDRNPSPTEWVRLPLENERGGCTELNEPMIAMFQTDRGAGRVTIKQDPNPLFAPFDLTHPEWYSVLDKDGEEITRDPDEVAALTSFDPNGFYNIYMRPANWRWVVTVIAHYWYISWFEAFPTDEIFTQAYFQRPPIYPKRHKVNQPDELAGIEVNDVYHVIDPAIGESFDLSRSSRFLRQQIIEAQWWTLSETYTFAGNEPPTIAITQYPPEINDIVLGIGRTDYPGGEEETLWIKQVVHSENTCGWTPQFLEYYLTYWFVAQE